jgi:hypothetical protein
MNPGSAVEGELIERGANLPQRRQWVSTSEEMTAVNAVHNGVKQIEAASQASRKTLKLNTPVSSLLQVCPSLSF